MTLSLNQRAHELADRLAADADALRVAVRTLSGGTRLIDCGSAVPGGLEAGRRLAEICMGGLGSVDVHAARRSTAAGCPGSRSSPTTPRSRAWPRSTRAGRSTATATSRWPAGRAAR